MKLGAIQTCLNCGSKYRISDIFDKDHPSRKHVCIQNRDRDNDPTRPEIEHHVVERNSAGMCNRCGGMNPECKYCGGGGRIS